MTLNLQRIIFLCSIVFALISILSPWAYLTMQVGEAKPLLDLPTFFMIADLKIHGCVRGLAVGHSQQLDAWIWLGRVSYGIQMILWTIYLTRIILRNRIVEGLLWIVGLELIHLALVSFYQRGACVWTVLPPPLHYMDHWQVALPGAISLLAGILCGTWAILSIRRENPRRK